MTTFEGPAESACEAVRLAGLRPLDVNPVLRLPYDAAGVAAAGAALEGAPDDARRLLLHHALSAAVLVVATTTAAADGTETTRRVRIGLDPIGPTVESVPEAGTAPGTGSLADMVTRAGDATRRWQDIEPRSLVPAAVSVLPEGEQWRARARLTPASQAESVRLTPSQQEAVVAARAAGGSARSAVAPLEDVDPILRDVLGASGPRTAVTLSRHDPSGRLLSEPSLWTRMWVVGEHGLCRLDPEGAGTTVSRVEPGDVLGTIVAMLGQGLEFTTALTMASAR
ncbi:hypothetical protein [Brachybacterium huguangmaarense]